MATERILPAVTLRASSGQAAQATPGAPAGAAAGDARPSVWVAGPGSAAAPARRTAPVEPIDATGKAARLARRRGDALLSTTTRAGMLIGVSAAIYAVSLATISGLQAQSQTEAAAQDQPAIDAVAQAQAANDALEAAIRDADARTRALAAEYDTVSTDMTAYQAQFAQLSALVAKVQGSAAKLNANFKLPAVTMHGAVGGGGGGGTVVVTTTSASGKP